MLPVLLLFSLFPAEGAPLVYILQYWEVLLQSVRQLQVIYLPAGGGGATTLWVTLACAALG